MTGINDILFGDAGSILLDWALLLVCTIAAAGKAWHIVVTKAVAARIGRMFLLMAWSMLAFRMAVPLLRGDDPIVGALAQLSLLIMATGSIIIDWWDQPKSRETA